MYTLFKCTQNIFQDRARVGTQNESLNQFKKIEMTSSTFSDHNAMKLEINHTNNTEKHTKTGNLNNMLVNNEWVNEIEEEIKRYFKTNETEDTSIQNLWDTGKVIRRGNFTALQAYLRQQEKAQINNLTSHLKELEKEQQNPK